MRTRFSTSAFRVTLATIAILFSVSALAEKPLLQPFEGNPGILVEHMDDTRFYVQEREQGLYPSRDYPGFHFWATLTGSQLSLNVMTWREGVQATHLYAGKLFEKMMRHFRDRGQRIDAIYGNWGYGSNLNVFNDQIRLGKTPEQAALLTWTGRQAAKFGYVNAFVEDYIYSHDSYDEVNVLFTRPATEARTAKCSGILKPSIVD